MRPTRSYALPIGLAFLVVACGDAKQPANDIAPDAEQHRPLIHFTPKKAWMNDPNGTVFFNGTYHLFYQFYPDSTVWGPMHWGHATSPDLLHWTHKPVALYPDSLGYVFSGSAVVDPANSSGFGKAGKTPLVAIFTQHDPEGEKAGRDDFQTQGLAYSLDGGDTWSKYAGNPVLNNPGIRDFRDPKVSWNEAMKKWLMVLATKDRVAFYSSPNLREWRKESEFGEGVGAHGGVWECPDLFALPDGNKTVWVLTVSLNPGGPNGGSATQYFLGDFDGRRFVPADTTTRWVDYGPDDYAGVTWSNTGHRKIFLGWMSNWQYATQVPTKAWRSAMTLPRELGLRRIGERLYLTSRPTAEFESLLQSQTGLPVSSLRDFNITSQTGALSGAYQIKLAGRAEDVSITFSNKRGQKLVVGYDKASNRYFIDRTASGKVSFEKGFAAKHYAPRLASDEGMQMTLVVDAASVELFADDGLTVMTAVFFPDEDFTDARIQASERFSASSVSFARLKPLR